MKQSAYFLILITSLSLWGCPETPPDPPADPTAGEMTSGETAGGFFTDVMVGGETTVQDMEMDMEPMEASPCSSDDECFPGRICVEEACQDSECQADSDCSAERPVCFGEEGEEPGQRRGRCGDCSSDDECAGRSTCELFSNASGDATGGLCQLEGNCEGSRECAPSSLRVIRGPLSEVCLDRRDSERDPVCADAFNCQGDDACPEGLRCLESGQCATSPSSETCTESAQCGFGEVCRQDGLCGPCQSANDCGAAQVCNAGVCAEVPGSCADDADCLGARRCVLNECTPPECVEDNFGDHSTFESAIEIDGDRVYRNLVSCGDDWYSFLLEPAMNAQIAVRQRDRGGNLGLQILDEEQRELGRSIGAAPVEVARARESAAPRLIYVRVFQEGPASVAGYDLEITYTPADSEICLDDPFELNGGDDDLDNARIVRFSQTDSFPPQVRGQICAADTDVLCFEMRRGELLTIEGEVDLGDALIVGSLVDPQGGELAEGKWAADLNPIHISQQVEQSGRYCLLITSDTEETRRAGQGRYTLKMNGVSPELSELCESKTPLMLTDQRGGELGELSGEDVIAASCAPSDGPEAVYTVNVTSPSLMVARVAGVPAGTLGDPVISLREQCDRETSELACSARGYDANNPYVTPPNPAVLRAAITPPVDPVTGEGVGQYTLIIDGVNVGNQPNYQVDVELRPLAPPPVNDTCDRIATLELEEGVGVVEASLDQASADLNTCGEGGPDVTYSFTLAERSDVTIQVGAKPAEFPVVVSLSDQCGGPEIACGFGVVETLEAGEYHVTVAGADSMSRGLVELQVSATPLPGAPSNETCANAEVLSGASGSVSGDTSNAANDYDLGASNLCTRDNTNSGEVVYRYSPTSGETTVFSAIPAVGWDLSLYIVDSCDGDLEQACLAGQDGALTETISFTAQNNRDIYLVVDGANGEAGAFELTWGPAE